MSIWIFVNANEDSLNDTRFAVALNLNATLIMAVMVYAMIEEDAELKH